ncbi:MAG: hypothetical protein K2X81_05545, partial [Candidatus Obscuribacterales bacterium]|nr:hypothetical protein [Candidatus Obscuribacterales bacterium]
ASNNYKVETNNLSNKLGDLNKQIAALSESITSIKAKHQQVQAELVQFVDIVSDPATILQELTCVQNLRKLIADLQVLLTEGEVLSARINDKARAKNALEQSSAEKSFRYHKLIAILIVLIGLSLSVYLGMAHGVVIAGCGVIVTAMLAFLLFRTPPGTAAPLDSSSSFAEEIVQLEAQLASIEKKQHEHRDSIAQLSIPLSLPLLPSLEECDILQQSLTVVSERLAKKAALSAEAVKCEEEITRLSHEISGKQQELSVVEITRNNLGTAWHKYLQSVGINNTLEPDAVVPDIERLVETSKKALKLQKSLRALEQDLVKITSSLADAGVVVSCDQPEEQDWLIAIEHCLQENTASRALVNKRFLQQNRFNDAEKSCQFLEKDLAECLIKRDSVLASQVQAQLAWQQWLTQAGLPTTSSCDEVLSLIDNLADVNRLRNDLRTQLALSQSLHQSTQLYRALAGRVPFIGSKAQELTAPELADMVLKLIEKEEERQEYDKQRSVIMERIKALAETISQCKNRITELLQLRDVATSEYDELLQDWRAWLLHHSLDTDLTTQTATDILPIVNSLQSLINERSELLERQSRAQEKVQEFQEHCKKLFSKLELEAAHLPESFEQVSEIHKTLQSQLHLQTTNVALTNQIQDARQKVASSTIELQAVTAKLKLLLHKAGVESSDQFQQRQNQFKEYQQLVTSISNQQVQLTKLLGKTGFSDVEAIYAAFDMSGTLHQANQLKLKAEKIGETLDGIGGEDSDERTGLRHKISNLINERDRLAQSHELVDARSEEERLRKGLEDLSHDWAKYTVAKHLLTLAKQRFEKEGQPHVIEMASSIFTDMTSGKYISVIPKTDQPGEFSVEYKQHDRVSAELLSTGTQEQLYLALRLAFIKHRTSQAEPLPIIMDDVLVNFDDVRASQAANVVREFSNSHQVLYFTCHPSTVAMFRTIDPDVQVINLSPNKTADLAISRLLDKFQSTATVLNPPKLHE